MPLDTDQTRIVRSWVGEAADQTSLDDRYDALLDIDLVIEEEINYQISALLEQPEEVRGPDGISYSNRDRIKYLMRRLDEFKKQGGTIGLGSTAVGGISTKLARPDYR
jgi:hypothetical protein